MKKNISFVIPVYNEEGNVADLYKEITEVCKSNNLEFEIIFIDENEK